MRLVAPLVAAGLVAAGGEPGRWVADGIRADLAMGGTSSHARARLRDGRPRRWDRARSTRGLGGGDQDFSSEGGEMVAAGAALGGLMGGLALALYYTFW
jgi:hypothetical protein